MNMKTIDTAGADLNALRVFAAVADAGGITAGAELLGLSKARVSIEVSRLEALLGVSLFSRTTRRVALTDAGQALYGQAVPPLRDLQDALARAQAGQGAAVLTGTLRISATVDHAAQALAPIVAAFAAQHPQLQIDLRSSDRVVDIVKEGIDVAIRMGWLRDSTLRATRLGDFEQHLVAAPGYLRQHGTPKKPEDLAQHPWIALSMLPHPADLEVHRPPQPAAHRAHEQPPALRFSRSGARAAAGRGGCVGAGQLQRQPRRAGRRPGAPAAPVAATPWRRPRRVRAGAACAGEGEGVY